MKDSKKFLRKTLQLLTALTLTAGYLGVIPPRVAQAAVIDVDTLVDENDHSCSDGDCSLRDAVELSSSGGYINFDSALAESTLNLSSEIIIDKDLTIAGIVAGDNIQISGMDANRIFSITAGVEVWIHHLDLVDGRANEGGAIYNQGDLQLTYCGLDGNYGIINGGAIYTTGDLGVSVCTLSNNSAGQDGGAIYNASTSEQIVLTTSTYSTNSSGLFGGGLYTEAGTNTIFQNNTFIENSSSYGGGIDNRGLIKIMNATLSHNDASLGGGGLRNSSGAELILINTIIANSTDGGDCLLSGGTLSGESTHYLVEDGSCSAPITGDPILDELRNNGGQTETMAVLFGSPAIDTGNDAKCMTADQRFISRPQEEHCDLGSFERVVVDTIGLYDPNEGDWALKNDNASGDADILFGFGPGGAGWKSLSGDWNKTGEDSIGLYNPATSKWYLKNSNASGPTDTVFRFGPVGMGWIPISGDWDNDGTDTAGFYSPITSKFYLRNSHTAGAANVVFRFGPAGMGWLPFVGDWDDDGEDSVGLYNPLTSKFYLRNSHTAGAADVVFRFGVAGAGWLPVAGDWDDDGFDTVGLYKPSNSKWYLRNSTTDGAADLTFSVGPASSTWTPLAGKWE